VAGAEPIKNSFSSIVMLVRLYSGHELIWKSPFSVEKGLREVQVLTTLSHLSYVPRVVHHSQIGEKYSIFMAKLPGQPLDGTPESDSLLFKQLGGALAAIHRDGLRVTASPVNRPTDWWRSNLRGDFAARSQICRRAFGKDWSRLTSRFEELLAVLSDEQQLCFVHADFRLANVLYEHQSVTGIVDFESSYVGLPQIDVLRMISELGGIDTARARAFLDGYGEKRPIPPDLSISAELFRLHNSIACMSWCIKRGEQNSEFFTLHLNRAMTICTYP
jgi:Ser/Thr protein kinase RdoA (MazF antagonist)